MAHHTFSILEESIVLGTPNFYDTPHYYLFWVCFFVLPKDLWFPLIFLYWTHRQHYYFRSFFWVPIILMIFVCERIVNLWSKWFGSFISIFLFCPSIYANDLVYWWKIGSKIEAYPPLVGCWKMEPHPFLWRSYY